MWRAGATRTPGSPEILAFIMSVFIQWNICGLQANREELSLLVSQYDPTAICIQETLLHSNKTASFKNYSYYGIPAVENNSSLHGGVAVLIKNSTPHQQLHTNTGLQAIALRATCHKTITICSIYLSPSIAYNITELEDLIRQLPPPVLLLGILMHTVSNGAPPNAALEERWWRTFSSNLTYLSLIVAHLPTFTLLLHHFELSTSA